jgi:hypothetical protein
MFNIYTVSFSYLIESLSFFLFSFTDYTETNTVLQSKKKSKISKPLNHGLHDVAIQQDQNPNKSKTRDVDSLKTYADKFAEHMLGIYGPILNNYDFDKSFYDNNVFYKYPLFGKDTIKSFANLYDANEMRLLDTNMLIKHDQTTYNPNCVVKTPSVSNILSFSRSDEQNKRLHDWQMSLIKEKGMYGHGKFGIFKINNNQFEPQNANTVPTDNKQHACFGSFWFISNSLSRELVGCFKSLNIKAY